MATPTSAIQRVRKARRNAAPPATTDFDRYRSAYTELLTEIREIGGDPVIDEVTDWIVDQVNRTGHLPTPSRVRERTNDVARERGISIPDGSPLQTKRERQSATKPGEGDVDDPDDVFRAMVPFEPYTDEQIAADLAIQKRKAREYLKRLEEREEIHTRKPAGSPRLWIREPKPQQCPNCGREFEVKYLHVVFSSSRFCPRCGARV